MPLVTNMMHLRDSASSLEAASRPDLDHDGGLAGWWILPSVVLELLGWIAIFYGLGLL